MNEAVIKALVDEELEVFKKQLESALATSMRKALDTVTTEYEERLRSLEEDQARILRHLGL
jgi:hypothetical protein